METVSGVNNWKLVIRREAAGVTLLRAVTCDERAALPEELFGLPVTALGDHALAPTAGEAEGEAVQVTCGPVAADADWNNHGLRELTLPPSLRRVGDYAFLNCDRLKTLRLWDGVTFWGGGALMNCRTLDTFHLTRTGEQGESLAYFADEPQDADAEDVHVFPQPRHGAGGGKGHGADELQDQDENIQRIHGGFLTAPRTGPSP